MSPLIHLFACDRLPTRTKREDPTEHKIERDSNASDTHNWERESYTVKKEEWKQTDKRQEKVDHACSARYHEDDPMPALGLASKKQTMMV